MAENSRITAERFAQLMMQSDDLIMDLGTCLDGKTAVQEGLIDSIGGIGDALEYLYGELEKADEAQKNG